jgi:hypothetical protein
MLIRGLLEHLFFYSMGQRCFKKAELEETAEICERSVQFFDAEVVTLDETIERLQKEKENNCTRIKLYENRYQARQLTPEDFRMQCRVLKHENASIGSSISTLEAERVKRKEERRTVLDVIRKSESSGNRTKVVNDLKKLGVHINKIDDSNNKMVDVFNTMKEVNDEMNMEMKREHDNQLDGDLTEQIDSELEARIKQLDEQQALELAGTMHGMPPVGKKQKQNNLYYQLKEKKDFDPPSMVISETNLETVELDEDDDDDDNTSSNVEQVKQTIVAGMNLS